MFRRVLPLLGVLSLLTGMMAAAVEELSPCQVARGTHTVYLDRQTPSCSTGKLMNGLHFTDSACTWGYMRYKSYCEPSGTAGACRSVSSDCFPVGWATTDVLDDQRALIDCPAGQALSSFQLVHCSGGKMRYSVSCCDASQYETLKEQVRYTSCQYIDKTPIDYLDRHLIKCNDDEVLTRLRMVTDGCVSPNKRFEYYCAPPSNAVASVEQWGSYCQFATSWAVYLDRHKVECYTGMMNGFYMSSLTCAANHYRYKASCEVSMTGGKCTTHYTGCLYIDGAKGIEHLDHTSFGVQCPAGKAVTDFQLIRCSGGHQYKFNCCGVPEYDTSLSSYQYSACSIAEGRFASTMERHYVKCNDDEVLTGFHLSGGCPVVGDRRYRFKCAPRRPLKYYGCYEDGPTRTLPFWVTPSGSSSMTIDTCVSACKSRNYLYAGLQYSSYCFCGNSLPIVKKPTSECTMACSGDGSEICGGGYRNSIYDSAPPATASPPGATPAPITTLSNGLIVHYEMNGNGQDSSGNNLHATIVGAVSTVDREGKADSAYYFDGANDYFGLGTSITGKAVFSMSAWINIDSYPSAAASIVSSREMADGRRGWFVQINSQGIPQVGFNPAFFWTQWLNGQTAIPIGEWVHISAVLTGSGVLLYVDGAEVATSSVSGTMVTDESLADTSTIGAKSTVTQNFFHGTIDDVRIYDRALNPTEVLATKGNAVISSGLVGQFDFSGSLTDASGNGNDGSGVDTISYSRGRDGSANTAFSPSGSSHVVVSASSTATFTIATWVNLHVNGGSIYESKRGNALGYEVKLSSSNELIVLLMVGTLHTENTGVNLVLHQWYHIAVSFSGRNLLIYVNGARVKLTSIPTGSLSTSSGDAVIGRNLNGLIDSINVYANAQGPSVIAGLCAPVVSAASDDLIAYYPFAGSALDIITSTTATVTTAALIEDRYNVSDSAYAFNGQMGSINGGSRTLTTFSVSAWVNRIAVENNGVETIVAHKNTGFAIGFDVGRPFLKVYNQATNTMMTVTSATAVQYSDWHQVTGTFDGSAMKLYVNGSRVAFAVNSGGPLSNAAADLIIGAKSSQDGDIWRGMIDEVRVYGVALTAERVATMGNGFYRRTQCIQSLSQGVDVSGEQMKCTSNEEVASWSFFSGSCAADNYVYEYKCSEFSSPVGSTFTRENADCIYAHSFNSFLDHVSRESACATSEKMTGFEIISTACATHMFRLRYSCSSSVGSDGLMAFYGFDAASMTDLSSVAGTGLLFGGVQNVADVTGTANKAIDFGGRAYVDIGNNIDAPYFTVMAWVKPSRLNTGQDLLTIVSSRENEDEGFVLRMRGNRYEVSVNPARNGFSWQTAGATRNGILDWEHIAATYDGSTLKLYLMGVLEKSYSLPAGPLSVVTGKTVIGARYHSVNGFRDRFPGIIDDVRIYNQPLDAAQILALRGALPASVVRAGAELVVDLEATYLMCTRTAIDETPPGFCWRKINEDCYTGLSDCGFAACSYSTSSCVLEIIAMTSKASKGVITLASNFVGPPTVLSYSMNKLISAGYSTSVAMVDSGFQRAKDYWKNTDPAFLPARVTYAVAKVKELMPSDMRLRLSDQQITDTCTAAVNQVHWQMRSKTSASRGMSFQAANSLGIASIKTDCGRVAQGNPTPNERIACAKAALRLAELVDPTGLAAIASAFLHPNCP